VLFTSPLFIFVFLPIALGGFFILGRYSRPLATAWAVGVSLAFYAYDDPKRLAPLIIASVAGNFLIGRSVARTRSRTLLAFGIAGNLAALGYFKYAEFLLGNVAAFGISVPQITVVLPIGISFYTFTQIAFLVDAYRGEAKEYDILNYALFVTYFPHLVAGPILHHKEMMPQFQREATFHFSWAALAVGLSWCAIGMFKKVVLADNISSFANQTFATAQAGGELSFGQAWIGALSFALQIYFDFSGYTDMAIGLAAMMGIKFPLNFLSPYKATSLIDFWRCWHMTLSRFLRDYLYIPLGGNRHGAARRYLNLLITMILGGLWHGASWTFVAWGAMHGVGLAINHLWREAAKRLSITLPAPVGQVMTLLLVIAAWVTFRADSFHAATAIWSAMFSAPSITALGASLDALGWIAGLSAIALFAPNTHEIFQALPLVDRKSPLPLWRPRASWALTLGAAFGIAVAAATSRQAVFLYFRF
jgi:D-alanyl-lipoteichoic acid acyltransferase DltB (MBOAT superfamily)